MTLISSSSQLETPPTQWNVNELMNEAKSSFVKLRGSTVVGWRATFLLSTLLLASVRGTESSAGVTTSTEIFTIPLISYRELRERRRELLVRNHSSIPVASLFSGYGTHYVSIFVGSPPQRQTAIVDTGSDTTGFPCSPGCQKCGASTYHLNPAFEPQRSSTFESVACDQCSIGRRTCEDGKCPIKASYREGSGWSAYEVQDMCYLGGPQDKALAVDNQSDQTAFVDGMIAENAAHFRFSLRFACQTSVTGAFRTQLADGILGMQNSSKALWSQVYQQYAVTGKPSFMKSPSFSLCFANTGPDDNVSLRKGSRAGLLTLGGVDSRIHTCPMVYSEMTGPPSRYFPVTLRKIYLVPGTGYQGRTVQSPILLNITESALNAEGVIVDSGSTDTYFTSQLAAPFQHVWSQLVGKAFDPDEELTVSAEEIEKLPTLLIQLKGHPEYNSNFSSNAAIPLLAHSVDHDHPFDVLISIRPSQLYEYSTTEKKYYPHFHFDKHFDGALGASAMIGYDIFFDVTNNRIGWAQSSCDYERIVGANNGSTTIDDSVVSTTERIYVDPNGALPGGFEQICSTPFCRICSIGGAAIALVYVSVMAIWRRRRSGRHPEEIKLARSNEDQVYNPSKTPQKMGSFFGTLSDGDTDEHFNEIEVGFPSTPKMDIEGTRNLTDVVRRTLRRSKS